MVQSKPKKLAKDSILNQYEQFLYDMAIPYSQVIEVFSNFEIYTCINMYITKMS